MGVCGGGLEGSLGVVYDLEAGLGVQAFEEFVKEEEEGGRRGLKGAKGGRRGGAGLRRVRGRAGRRKERMPVASRASVMARRGKWVPAVRRMLDTGLQVVAEAVFPGRRRRCVGL